MELRRPLALYPAGQGQPRLTAVIVAVVVVPQVVHSDIPVADVAVVVRLAPGDSLGQALDDRYDTARGVIRRRARLPSVWIERLNSELGKGRRFEDAFLPYRAHSCEALEPEYGDIEGGDCQRRVGACAKRQTPVLSISYAA